MIKKELCDNFLCQVQFPVHNRCHIFNLKSQIRKFKEMYINTMELKYFIR